MTEDKIKERDRLWDEFIEENNRLAQIKKEKRLKEFQPDLNLICLKTDLQQGGPKVLFFQIGTSRNAFKSDFYADSENDNFLKKKSIFKVGILDLKWPKKGSR